MATPITPNTQAPVDPRFMFSNHKNVHKPAIEKRQRKLLQKIPFIGAFLEPDEKIRLVSTCVSPTSLFEQLAMGWIFAIINRALLVVTNKGVLHIPTTPNFGYRNSIAKFRYDDCNSLRIRGNALLVQYAGGKKERFMYLPRTQRLKLKDYFQSLTLGAGAKSNAQKSSLCPRCTKPLTAGVYQCPNCRLEFKDMASAVRLSILVPGGGYFYTGHPILGVGDFVTELFLLVMTVTGIAGIFQGAPDGVFTTVFFGVILVIEKLLTIHHAKRFVSEYIPKEKAVQLRPLAA